jgi:hypothetical protein
MLVMSIHNHYYSDMTPMKLVTTPLLQTKPARRLTVIILGFRAYNGIMRHFETS